MKRQHIQGKKRRSYKIRMKIRSTSSRIRLVVDRSNKHIAAQLIDDKKKRTLVTVHDRSVKQKEGEKITKTQKAQLVGQQIAEVAKKHKITEVVFDRSGYRYHGRTKALADSAREAGLKF